MTPTARTRMNPTPSLVKINLTKYSIGFRIVESKKDNLEALRKIARLDARKD